MKITIDFKTDNAAFSDYMFGEIEMIMDSVKNKIGRDMTEGKVFDSNGNTVGKWEVTDAE